MFYLLLHLGWVFLTFNVNIEINKNKYKQIFENGRIKNGVLIVVSCSMEETR